MNWRAVAPMIRQMRAPVFLTVALTVDESFVLDTSIPFLAFWRTSPQMRQEIPLKVEL